MSLPFDELYRRSNLTRRQILLWLGHKLRKDVPDQNEAFLFRVDGPLDEGAFATAVQALVDGSDALRTVVLEDEGLPRQVVQSRMDSALQALDLSGEPEPRVAALTWARQRGSQCLDISTRLFDFALLRLDAEEWAFFVVLHHLICDSVTLSLLYEYLSLAYARALGGGPVTLDLPPYAEYLADEREYNRSPQHDEDARYWQGILEPPPGPLLLYGRRSAGVESEAEAINLTLGRERSERLEAMVRKQSCLLGPQAAMQTMLYTALFAWLHRAGPNETGTIGMTFHNRRSRFARGLGRYAEIVPLRVSFEADETFASLEEKVKTRMLEAIRHGRHVVQNPLHHRAWDVLLNYQRLAFGDFAGLPAEAFHVKSGHALASVLVHAHDDSAQGEVRLEFEVIRKSMPAELRHAVPGHFLRVLDALLDDPAMPLAQVDMLGEDEKKRLIVGFNPCPDALPSSPPGFVARFEEQVRRAPSRVALWFGQRRWTYAQVDAEANRLAGRLRAAGVGPGHCIGIIFGRQPELLTALLATLKVGATYVPLDAGHTPEQLAFALTETQAYRVIGSRTTAARLRLPADQVVSLEEDPTEMPAMTPWVESAPTAAVDDQSPACILFPFQDGDRPEGVVISHGAIAAWLEAMGQAWLEPNDVIPAIHSLSSELHLPEWLLPLARGATVRLVGREVGSDGMRLREELVACRATAMVATPLACERLLEAGWSGNPRMKLQVAGGRLPADLVRQLLPRVREAWAAYGFPETTPCAALGRLSAAEPLVALRPLPHAEIVLLDRQGRLVPLGSPGEICIGGRGLADGYLGKPDRTNARFVSHPCRERTRLFCSGDLGCWRPDGVLEVLGRVDVPLGARGPADLAASADAVGAALPTDLVEFQLVKLFEQELKVSGLTVHDNFFDLGGTSLLGVRVLAQVEKLLGHSVPSLMTLFEAPTASKLARVLRRDGWQPRLAPVVPLQPDGDRPPLFFVHAFIGDVCRDLAPNLHPRQPVYGLQPRGLDGHEEPLRTVEEMAAYYLQQVRSVQPEGPYFIGGYSFGGFVAYEMARLLELDGQPVGAAIIVDTIPPNIVPHSFGSFARSVVNPLLVVAEKVAAYVQHGQNGRRLSSDGEVEKLSAPVQGAGLGERLCRRARHALARRQLRLGGEADAEVLEEMLQAYPGMGRWPSNYQRIARVNLEASLRYVPRPSAAHVVLVRRAAPLRRWALEDPTWGWGEVGSDVEVHRVETDAGHNDLMNEPYIRPVAAVIEVSLEGARSRPRVRSAATARAPFAFPLMGRLPVP